MSFFKDITKPYTVQTPPQICGSNTCVLQTLPVIWTREYRDAQIRHDNRSVTL